MKKKIDQFSDVEKRLFNALDISSEVLDSLIDIGMTIPAIYKNAAEEAFVFNKKGPAIEALRAAMQALFHNDILRRTLEFDNIISNILDEPDVKGFIGL
jgi:hypothetical protein